VPAAVALGAWRARADDVAAAPNPRAFIHTTMVARCQFNVRMQPGHGISGSFKGIVRRRSLIEGAGILDLPQD